MGMKRITSERLIISLARYRRAKRHLIAALKAECPDAALVHRRGVFRLECDGSGSVRLRESRGVRLAAPKPPASEPAPIDAPQ